GGGGRRWGGRGGGAAWGYCAMTSRHSSASSCCESGVEPTKSQKSTVSWRRSPAGAAASGAGVGVGAPDAGATVGSRAPQPPQNFSPGSFAASHAAQIETIAAPHLAQKRRSRRLACPQDGQRTVPLAPMLCESGGTEPSRLVLHGSEVCQRLNVLTCFGNRPTGRGLTFTPSRKGSLQKGLRDCECPRSGRSVSFRRKGRLSRLPAGRGPYRGGGQPAFIDTRTKAYVNLREEGSLNPLCPVHRRDLHDRPPASRAS